VEWRDEYDGVEWRDEYDGEEWREQRRTPGTDEEEKEDEKEELKVAWWIARCFVDLVYDSGGL
jgi:hypothetical protein